MKILKEKVKVTPKQNRDFVLLCCIGFLLAQKFGPPGPWWLLALICALCAFFLPWIFTPVTYVWFLFGDILGSIVTKCILVLVFFLIIFPISIFKRRELAVKFGLKKALEERITYFDLLEAKVFKPSDIENPY